MDSDYRTKTGWLCLDFANTVDWHASSHPVENITNYSDLLEWSKQVGIVSDIEADLLARKSEEKKKEAQVILHKARGLREAIYHAFADTIRSNPVKPSDLNVLNKAIIQMSLHSRLMPHDIGFSWHLDHNTDELDCILWPIIRSALDLMTSETLQRVGQCADEQGCGWLFYDTSRNRSRRWCDMSDCGNRAKVRRYYEKSKKQ